MHAHMLSTRLFSRFKAGSDVIGEACTNSFAIGLLVATMLYLIEIECITCLFHPRVLFSGHNDAVSWMVWRNL